MKQKASSKIIIPETHIENLGDYVKFIQSKVFTDTFVLFRGQSEDWPLLPNICRLNLINEILEAEQAMLDDFKRNGTSYLKPMPTNDWEWLSIAQHHGLPTRLLDWTQNPLAALWFTVQKPSANPNVSGVVWLFRPKKQDIIKNIETSHSPFSGERTKVFHPVHVADRIKSQDSVFTVHKYMEKSAKFIALQNNKANKPLLHKIIIKAKNFPDLRNLLHRCGVNAATLFPDLDGIARYATWRHARENDD